MKFNKFFERCQIEPTVSDFESYLAHCIFEKKAAETKDEERFTVEMYSHTRDQAFERRDEKAAQLLFDLAGAATWQEGDWEGSLR
jgi:hypothetical protein